MLAAAILGAVAVFAVASFGLASTRHTGTKAPAAIIAEDGHSISLGDGKVFRVLLQSAVLHCLEAGRRLTALNWGDMVHGQAGLTGKSPVSKDLALLQETFPFDTAAAE